MKTVLEGKPGDVSQFIAIVENKIIRKPLLEAVASTQAVAEAIKAKDFKKAMELRGPEFAEYYDPHVCLPFTIQFSQWCCWALTVCL